jgi:GAF domain-containing protein
MRAMDIDSILDHTSASPAVEGDMPGTSASRSAVPSVSAGIAAANAHRPKSSDPGPRFPAEDGGRSLAEMAHADLDAVLQLLAERAQYITGATGAAIALRRGEHNDMLCRASTGSNAPQLGALLSMEYGLSGECVRTRQPLRCDDAEREARVNREVCRQLGIASVVVMPIASDDQVLGVFELFSGKPHAFDERALSALQRLSEMVETAVKHAAVTQTPRTVQEPPTVGLPAAELQPPVDEIAPPLAPPISATFEREIALAEPDIVSAPPEAFLPPPVVEKIELEKPKPEPAPASKKPLFWSAATHTSAGRTDETAESIPVPPVLRNLQKCQACGFPVSQGRTFCVECEEKQWRGQGLPAQSKEPAPSEVAPPAPAGAVTAPPENTTTVPIEPSAIAAQTSLASEPRDLPADVPASYNSTLFLSSASPSESWFASNKFILGALLVVAIVIAAIVFLR